VRVEISQPQCPIDNTRQAIVATALHRANSQVEYFLENTEMGVNRLACTNCSTSQLCGAVAANLLEQTDDGMIPVQDIPTLEGHGIHVTKANDLCPTRLVTATISRTQNKDFWLPSDDHSSLAPQQVQIVETLRIAIQTLKQRLDGNQRI